MIKMLRVFDKTTKVTTDISIEGVVKENGLVKVFGKDMHDGVDMWVYFSERQYKQLSRHKFFFRENLRTEYTLFDEDPFE